MNYIHSNGIPYVHLPLWELKQAATELGVTCIGDKRKRENWVASIEAFSETEKQAQEVQAIINETWTSWEKEYCSWLADAKWCIYRGENKRIEKLLPTCKTLRLEGMKKGAEYCAIWEVSECVFNFSGFPLPATSLCTNLSDPKNMEKYLDFGKPISFGYTAQYLNTKTVTRRDWKDTYAAQFVRAFERAEAVGKKLRLPAIDKAYYAGGKQIGWLVLSHAPYKEKLKNMPQVDLVAEGGMCNSVKEFATKYFKGDLEKEVWVLGFRFQQLEVSKSLLDAEACDPVPEPIQNSFATDSAEKPPKSKTLETLTSAKSDEHGTPHFLAQAVREVLGTIDLDPMSNPAAQKIIQAKNFYTKEEDGLTKPWIGRIWLNPAFSLADEAVAKLIGACEVGICPEALLLIKAAPETKRNQSLSPYAFCELNKRVKFLAEGNKVQAPFSTLIFYLGKNFTKFKEVFSGLGNIRLGQNQVDELEGDRRELLAEVARLRLELAKKSEAGSEPEPDCTDWLERDLAASVGIAESRLQELELDREILPEDLYIRQRVEWQTKLECWKYTQQTITKIQTRLTTEYEELINRQHPAIEEEPGYTPDFAPYKLVESSAETGGFLVKIEKYWHTHAGWIAKCNVRISQRVARGENFLIQAGELFTDFHPWKYQKEESLPPQYSLGSIRTAKGLKFHFPGIDIPAWPRADSSEVVAVDGSIWQAFVDGNYTGRSSIKWRCEVLPDGFSRSPRIDNKKSDCMQSVALINLGKNSLLCQEL